MTVVMGNLSLLVAALAAVATLGAAVCWSLIDARRAQAAGLVILSGLVYSAGFLNEAVQAHYVLAGALAYTGFVVLLNRSGEGSRELSGRWVAGCCLWFVGLLMLSTMLSSHAGGSVAAFRIVGLAPLAFAVGFQIAHNRASRDAFRSAYIGVSTGFAVLAILEYVQGQLLFTRNPALHETLRNGHVRSTVLAEHPLVLASLIVAAVPFVVSAERLSVRRRTLLLALLAGGVLSTASRGAIAVVLLMLVLTWARHRIARLSQTVVSVGAVVIACGAVIRMSSSFGAGISLSDNNDAASLEYRSVLYQSLIRSLQEKPFGWGWNGLPEGVFTVAKGFGHKDLAETVDSEIALAGFEFGVLGLAVLLALLLMVVNTRSISQPESIAAIGILATGLYLSIHSWVGLLTAVMLLAGSSRASRGAGPDRTVKSEAPASVGSMERPMSWMP